MSDVFKITRFQESYYLQSFTECYRVLHSITECYRVLQSIYSASTWTIFWACFFVELYLLCFSRDEVPSENLMVVSDTVDIVRRGPANTGDQLSVTGLT